MKKAQLKQLKKHIEKNGGATLTHTYAYTALKVGYMVSIAGYEKIITLKRLNKRLLKKYALMAQRLGAYIGLWADDGALYIDLSINIIDKAQAIAEGLKNKQLAIYECATGECLRIK